MMIKNTFIFSLETIVFIALVFITNFPFAYAITHDHQIFHLFFTFTFTVLPIVYGLSTLSHSGFFAAYFISTLIGYITMLSSWFIFHINDLSPFITQLSLAYYTVGLLLPALPNLYRTYLRLTHQKLLWLNFMIQFGLLGLFLGLLLLELGIWSQSKLSITELFSFFIGIIISASIWILVKNVFIKKLHVYTKLVAYMSVMGKPIIGFFIGYLTIMLFFTGLYSLHYHMDNTSFNNLENDVFISMLYYSFSIITGLGFSVIEPEKPVTFFLTGLENFMGLVWITVVFAAALAYLQEPFKKLSKKMDIEFIDK